MPDVTGSVINKAGFKVGTTAVVSALLPVLFMYLYEVFYRKVIRAPTPFNLQRNLVGCETI